MEAGKTSDKTDPEVVLFGETVSERGCRKHDGCGGVWGVFLIFTGITLLLNTFSIVPWEIWQTLVMYWPVLLVLGGLHILLGNTFIARMLMTVIAVALLGAVFAVGIRAYRPELLSGLPPELNSYLESAEQLLKKP